METPEKEDAQIRRVKLFGHLPTPIHDNTELREVNLWRAVLDQALNDALLNPETTQDKIAKDKAIHWIKYNHLFETVCTWALLDPKLVRTALLDFIDGRRPLPDFGRISLATSD